MDRIDRIAVGQDGQDRNKIAAGQDGQDRRADRMEIGIREDDKINWELYDAITKLIIGSSFEVMNELGSGFLESVYRNALVISTRQKGLFVEAEKRYNVFFRGNKVGVYLADLVVNNSVVVELKCCDALTGKHKCQLINYLKCSNNLIGLLINFGDPIVEYKRLCHPNFYHTSSQINRIF